MRCLLFIIGNLFCLISMAQRIDHASILFEIPANSFFRIQYDNDLFQSRDMYYTQGVSLDFANPVFRQNPINKILISSSKSNAIKHGIRFETAAFTPTTILSDSILYNNRPYAATMFFHFYEMSYFNAFKMKLTADLQIGVLGPAALGKEIQTSIHQWTQNARPLGWQHQIQNDLILNYELRSDKELFSYRSLFALNGSGQLNLGTYQSNISVGLDFSFGRKNNLFSHTENKFQYFMYAQSRLKLVGYDASLMGGLFNQSSAYVISYSAIRKIVAEQHFGFVFQFPHVYFGTDFGFLTPEFSGGKSHAWGGIRLGFY